MRIKGLNMDWQESIHGSIMNDLFMVKTSKSAKVNDINKNQGIRLNGEGSATEESKQTQPLLTKIHVVGKKTLLGIGCKSLVNGG